MYFCYVTHVTYDENRKINYLHILLFYRLIYYVLSEIETLSFDYEKQINMQDEFIESYKVQKTLV